MADSVNATFVQILTCVGPTMDTIVDHIELSEKISIITITTDPHDFLSTFDYYL